MAKVPAKAEENALVTVGNIQLPAELLQEAAALAGQGVSTAAEDNIVPFLSLLQDLSPEVKKRESTYVEGAEPGLILNKATKQLFKPGELLVQPCAFQRSFVEWIPRTQGGGYVGRHAELPADAKEVPDPRKPDKKTIVVLPNGHELIDTRYHFVNILHADGTLEPAVLSFSSSGHQSSRAWMSLFNRARLPSGVPGQSILAPSFFKQYRVGTTTKRNNDGEWFVLNFEDAGWIQEGWVRQEGKNLHDSVMSGTIQAAKEEGGDAAAQADIPI